MVSLSFTGFRLHESNRSSSDFKACALCLAINLSPVCATADLFCTGLCCLLHHLGSSQVQRDPHTESTCGKGHRCWCQGREHVAPTRHEEAQAHTRSKRVIMLAYKREKISMLLLSITQPQTCHLHRLSLCKKQIINDFGRLPGWTRLSLCQRWENKKLKHLWNEMVSKLKLYLKLGLTVLKCQLTEITHCLMLFSHFHVNVGVCVLLKVTLRRGWICACSPKIAPINLHGYI